MYDKLLTKVNVVDTSRFALKTQYDTDKSGLEQKINDTDKKISAKISKIEGKIPSISGLATVATLTAVEHKGFPALVI